MNGERGCLQPFLDWQTNNRKIDDAIELSLYYYITGGTFGGWITDINNNNESTSAINTMCSAQQRPSSYVWINMISELTEPELSGLHCSYV